MIDPKYIINSAEYVSSHPTYKSLVHGNNHEYAFIGRSNVGKSSLINMLTGRKKLALVSKKPGKTKQINIFLINNSWNLIDLPGYGYAKVSKSERYRWSQSISDYFLKRRNLVNTFVLIDFNIPPQEIDLEFINYLGESMLPFSIVFTKADKVKPGQRNKNLNIYKKELLKTWEELPPVFLASSTKGEGRIEILDYIFKLNESIDEIPG